MAVYQQLIMSFVKKRPRIFFFFECSTLFSYENNWEEQLLKNTPSKDFHSVVTKFVSLDLFISVISSKKADAHVFFIFSLQINKLKHPCTPNQTW